MELWNAYEALVKYAKGHGYSVPTGIYSKSKKSFEGFFAKTKALQELKSLADKIKEKVDSDSKGKLKNEVDIYIKRIENSKAIESDLRDQASIVRDYVLKGKEMSGIEMLTMIYVERNMYYHNGEAGKMGISYSTRKFLLNSYIDYLTRIILITICYILEDQIKKWKKS